MPRPLGVQITRNRRKDGSTTYALRVRIHGTDERVPLGNTEDGWDEIRADQARKQLLAKIELGQWSRRRASPSANTDEEPTFRELATDWLEARRLNPGIRPRTVQFNRTQLTRYLAPFFGELRPSEITVSKIKKYRHRIHAENDQSARQRKQAGRFATRARATDSAPSPTTPSTRPCGHSHSFSTTPRTQAGSTGTPRGPGAPASRLSGGRTAASSTWTSSLTCSRLRSSSTGSTSRPPSRRRTLRGRCATRPSSTGSASAPHLGVAPTTAIYLYGCAGDEAVLGRSPRRAIIATLGLAGLRVGELCGLDNRDIDLAKARVHITDAKTAAGVRAIDIHPRLLDELATHRASWPDAGPDDPAFPTRAATRRTRSNILTHVIHPALARANQLRTQRDRAPIRAHLTPHTFRRSYISFMVAAGYDLPYIQAQVGHRDPSTTLAIYAQVIARPNRDELRSEIRQLLGTDAPPAAASARPAGVTRPRQLDVGGLKLAAEKAGKVRALLS